MVHTILFDVGGTLVQSDDIFEKLIHQIGSEKTEIYNFLKRRFAYYKNRHDKFLTVREILAECLRETAREFNTRDISRDAARIYEEIFMNSCLFEDTIPVLGKLQQLNMRMFVVSDADKEILQEELKKLGLLRYFDGLFISSEIKAYKPSEKVVQYVLEGCNCPKSEMLLVGDSLEDIETAKRMRIKSVLVDRDGYSDLKPDYKIRKLGDLLPIINLDAIGSF